MKTFYAEGKHLLVIQGDQTQICFTKQFNSNATQKNIRRLI